MSFAYEDGAPILRRLSVEVAAGETIAVQIFDPTFLKAEHPGYRW